MKRIFVCFDYDNDRNYRYLLSALKSNPRSDLRFTDVTPDEVQSDSVSAIKGALRSKINQATHTLVIVGKAANSYHADRVAIGTRNWQWWEIEASSEARNRFIAVKISDSYVSPEPLLGIGAKWARSFSVPSIVAAVDAT